MKPYQFPVKGKGRKATIGKPAVGSKKPRESSSEQVGLINGRTPGSTEEWRVAVALWKYKLEFMYQWPLYGGRLRKGGQVIDFVVSNPFPVPVYVNGEYWHEGQLALDDKLKMAEAEKYFGRPPVVLWGRELSTQDEANSAVAKAFL